MSTPLPLRDIHLPAEPGWWPPAPGWWVVGALLAVALAHVGVILWRRWRAQRRRRLRLRWLSEALAAAGQHGPARIAAATEYLRRLARADAPHALLLQGEDWLAYLDAGFDDQPFTRGAGRLLLDGGYRPQLDAASVETALAAVRRRVERGLP